MTLTVPGPLVPVYLTGTGSVDTPRIQAAITANPGKTIFLKGDTTLTATLTVSTARTTIDGDGTLTAGFTGGAMVRFLNCDYNRVGDGLFFDGNWQSGVTAVELMGAVLGSFRIRGDRLPVGISLDCANVSATQNSALNELWLMVRNGLKGMVFKGKSGQYASNNRVRLLDWWGAGSSASTGVEFVAYTDNNYFDRAYLHLGFAGSVGVDVNTQAPTSDVEVYENHGDFIIEGSVSGTTAIRGRRTWQTVGLWPSLMRVRLSGSSTPALDIAADSDVQLVDTNMNGAGMVGTRGEERVFASPAEIRNSTGATAGSNFGVATWTLPAAGTSTLNYQVAVPSRWRTYEVVALWATSDTGAGNVRFSSTFQHLAAGTTIAEAGGTTAVTGAAAGQNVVRSTAILPSVTNGGPMVWGRVSRLGDDAADTATGTCQVLGLVLRRLT